MNGGANEIEEKIEVQNANDLEYFNNPAFA